MHNILSTKERAKIFAGMLQESGVPQWGRASRISELCEVSHATASGWINGSLPRDCVSLLKCCDVFDLDVYEWVNGVARGKGVNTDKLKRNISKVKQHEENHVALSPERFSTLAIMLYENEEKAEYLLDNMSVILPE